MAIGHEPRRMICSVPEDAIQHGRSLPGIDALIAAAQDSDPAPTDLESAGELFDHRRFAGAADGQIPDTDDKASELAFFEDPVSIKEQPQLNSPEIEEREEVQRGAEQTGSKAMATLQDNFDSVLFQAVEPASHDQRIRAPRLSAPTIKVSA